MFAELKKGLGFEGPPQPGGFWDFVWSMQYWLRARPRRTRCSFCNRPMWCNISPSTCPMYCSKDCAGSDGPTLEDIGF